MILDVYAINAKVDPIVEFLLKNSFKHTHPILGHNAEFNVGVWNVDLSPML